MQAKLDEPGPNAELTIAGPQPALSQEAFPGFPPLLAAEQKLQFRSICRILTKNGDSKRLCSAYFAAGVYLF